MTRVLVTLTKSVWPYTKVDKREVVLQPGEKIRVGDGWVIAEVLYAQPGEPANEVDIFKVVDQQEVQQAADVVRPGWKTWPPQQPLTVGHEYLVRTRYGQQRHLREMRASYLGSDPDSGQSLRHHYFNARPAFGTQDIPSSMIVATKDLGKSEGRDDSRRYCNKVIR